MEQHLVDYVQKIHFLAWMGQINVYPVHPTQTLLKKVALSGVVVYWAMQTHTRPQMTVYPAYLAIFKIREEKIAKHVLQVATV